MNMQPIPRNKLLDKLEAGWKVRRSVWPKGQAISINGGSFPMSFEGLIADGWEGEPPAPQKKYCGCSLHNAVLLAQSNKPSFVRRESWPKLAAAMFGNEPCPLTLTDVMATDWEVWG